MDYMRVGASGIAVGLIDDQLERNDAKNGRTAAFKTATDIGRAAMVVGGVAVGLLAPSRIKMWGETVATAALPLLTKSVLASISTTSVRRQVSSFAARRMVSYAPPVDQVTRMI